MSSFLSSFRNLGLSGGQAWRQGPSTKAQLEGARVLLRLGKPLDWQAWRDLREESRAFLTPWEPTWPADALTFNAYTRNLQRQWKAWKEGRGYAFHLFLTGERSGAEPPQDAFTHFGRWENRPVPAEEQEDDSLPKETLIGALALAPIERGAAQRGRLGYWIGAPYAKQGLMTEALGLVLTFGFETLGLHRIEAECMPGNEASRKLLLKHDFQVEGTLRAALRINGAWEDHLLWAKVKG